MAWPDLASRVQGSVLRVLGEEAVLVRQDSSETECLVAFTEAAITITIVDGMPVETTGPQAFIRLSDFDPAPVKGDVLVVRGESFSVRDLRPDGQGAAVMMLHRG